MAKRIGVLTGGGDVPGLNVVIKTLTARMEDAGWEVMGLKRGWAALLHAGPGSPFPGSDWTVRLTRQNTRTIDRTGGTMLHSSRTNPMAVAAGEIPPHLKGRGKPLEDGKVDLTDVAIRTVETLGLDVLVAIGGDDTLSFARRLDEEGLPVIGIPKTMDNDVFGTDYCIGFSTAVSRSVNMITDLRSPAGSHERFLVVELFGRNCGETSLMVSLLCAADRALISEVPFDPDRVAELILRDKRDNPSNYALITVSEGARIEGGEVIESGEPDAFGHKKLGGIGRWLSEFLKEKTREGTVYQSLAYLMRSGPADSLDKLVAINFARIAADQVVRGETGRLVAVDQGLYTTREISIVGAGVRRVNVERYYDVEAYRPKLGSVIGHPLFLE
ncbi:MAG: 6-phosphofructokinase [Acidobacteriota bacterium]|nr:6-phosphofructokinase [Acidobacteriota bacterium]